MRMSHSREEFLEKTDVKRDDILFGKKETYMAYNCQKMPKFCYFWSINVYTITLNRKKINRGKMKSLQESLKTGKKVVKFNIEAEILAPQQSDVWIGQILRFLGLRLELSIENLANQSKIYKEYKYMVANKNIAVCCIFGW